MTHAAAPRWLRRAQPLLGTLVEVGTREGDGATAAIDAAFAAIRDAQGCLSRFDPLSDLSRFHRLRRGERIVVRPPTRQVLALAGRLQRASAGLFDISVGSAPDGWALRGGELVRLSERARLDLGGIGKGHAVDLAVQALRQHRRSAGWVNAGGDLRVFGDVELPLQLRDDGAGGVRPFALLRDGAFATSAFGAGHRAQLAGAPLAARVSVAAPRCAWADALTKVVAASGDPAHGLLSRYRARAWWHGPPR